MRIYLVQHGEAKSEEEDPRRTLTDKGIGEVQKVAEFLRPLTLAVDAFGTAERLARNKPPNSSPRRSGLKLAS